MPVLPRAAGAGGPPLPRSGPGERLGRSGDLLDRFLEDLDELFDVRRRLLRLGLVLDRHVPGELYLTKGLEDGWHVQHPAVSAVQDVRLPLVVVVLQVDPKVALAHDADLLG